MKIEFYPIYFGDNSSLILNPDSLEGIANSKEGVFQISLFSSRGVSMHIPKDLVPHIQAQSKMFYEHDICPLQYSEACRTQTPSGEITARLLFCQLEFATQASPKPCFKVTNDLVERKTLYIT